MIRIILKRVLDFILFGNIFISFGAVCLLWETNLLLEKPIRADGLAWMVFFSTLFIYTGHRLTVVRKVPKENHGPILQWSHKNSFLLFMIMLVSAGGALNSLFHVEFEVQMILLPLGAIAILYEVPLLRLRGKLWRLRDLGMMKVFWITIVWSVSTVILPVLEYGGEISSLLLLLILLKRMFFIFSLALCFDLRDDDHDRADGIRTIPVIYGEEVTKRLYWICTIGMIACGIVIFFVHGSYDWGVLAGITIAALMSYQFMLRARLFTSVYYYPLIVDGLMFLQFLWVFLGK